MHYAFERNGRLCFGEADEAEIQRMAIAYECEVQVWSHSIEHDDAEPMFSYDASGTKLSIYNPGD